MHATVTCSKRVKIDSALLTGECGKVLRGEVAKTLDELDGAVVSVTIQRLNCSAEEAVAQTYCRVRAQRPTEPVTVHPI